MTELNIVPFEKREYKDSEIIVDDVSVSYSQISDSSGKDGEETMQEITISTRNNGNARFLNIKTDSWSIEDIDELQTLINDFKQKAQLL